MSHWGQNVPRSEKQPISLSCSSWFFSSRHERGDDLRNLNVFVGEGPTSDAYYFGTAGNLFPPPASHIRCQLVSYEIISPVTFRRAACFSPTLITHPLLYVRSGRRRGGEEGDRSEPITNKAERMTS